MYQSNQARDFSSIPPQSSQSHHAHNTYDLNLVRILKVVQEPWETRFLFELYCLLYDIFKGKCVEFLTIQFDWILCTFFRQILQALANLGLCVQDLEGFVSSVFVCVCVCVEGLIGALIWRTNDSVEGSGEVVLVAIQVVSMES